MTTHSPEPWAFGWTGDPDSTSKDEAGPLSIVSWNRGDVASCKPWPYGHANTWEIVEANARRIVAAVNACRGIPTEDLEKMAAGTDGGLFPGYMQWLGYHMKPKEPPHDRPLRPQPHQRRS